MRACSASPFSPSASAIRASSTHTISLSFQPMRNFTVKGIVTALRMARKISPIFGRSRSSPDPPFDPTTRLAGQPRFRSTVSKPVSSTMRAASASVSGIRPEQLRSDGMLVVVKRQIAPPLRLPHPASPSADVNSVIISPHPDSTFVADASTPAAVAT